MEVYIFCVTICMITALVLIGIGICIGRIINAAEGISDGKLHNDNNNSVLHSNTNNGWHRDVGEDDGK